MATKGSDHDPLMRYKFETYTNSAVSARLIVVLCCTISCNSLFALPAFNGHANAAAAVLSLRRFDPLFFAEAAAGGNNPSSSFNAFLQPSIGPVTSASWFNKAELATLGRVRYCRLLAIPFNVDTSMRITLRSDGAPSIASI